MKGISNFSESSKKFFLYFFILTNGWYFYPLFAQPAETWVVVYGDNQYDRSRGIVQTYDKGYAVCGSTSSYGLGNTDFYLLKIDSMGKYKWHNTFGGINIEEAYSLKQTQDSGFVVAGFTNSLGNGGYDAFVIKTDMFGQIQWQKTYGGNDWDFAYWIEQTSDGGYIVAGETFSFGSNAQAYLIRTNSLGDTLWVRHYGYSGSDAFEEIHETIDSGFIAAGYTQAPTGNTDFFLVKTDKNGNLKWQKNYGSSANEICNSVAICNDGGFLLGGHRDTNNFHKTYFLKTDSDGNPLLEKTEMALNGNTSIMRIRQTWDGEYVLLQNTDVGGMGGKEIRLDKYNSGGWFLWGRSAGGAYNDEGYDFIQTLDSGFIFVGYTASYGAGPDNVFIVKTATDGNYNSTVNVYVSINEGLVTANEILIFPNPSTGNFNVRGVKYFTFRIYTIAGALIKEEKESVNTVSVDLPSGIYFLEIIKEEVITRRKIILVE